MAVTVDWIIQYCFKSYSNHFAPFNGLYMEVSWKGFPPHKITRILILYLSSCLGGQFDAWKYSSHFRTMSIKPHSMS